MLHPNRGRDYYIIRMAVWPSMPAFQRGAVPGARVGGDVVGALQKLEQDGVGVVGLAYRGVRKREFTQGFVERRRDRRDGRIPIAGRLGVGVGVEDTFAVGARPVSGAADFVGIGFDRSVVRRPDVWARCVRRTA